MTSITAEQRDEIVFLMQEAEKKKELSGSMKKAMVLNWLSTSNIIQEEQKVLANLLIDAIVWAAKNRQQIKAFAENNCIWQLFCCC